MTTIMATKANAAMGPFQPMMRDPHLADFLDPGDGFPVMRPGPLATLRIYAVTVDPPSADTVLVSRPQRRPVMVEVPSETPYPRGDHGESECRSGRGRNVVQVLPARRCHRRALCGAQLPGADAGGHE